MTEEISLITGKRRITIPPGTWPNNKMKLQVVEFVWGKSEPIEYDEDYRWTHLLDPETGKYYEFAPGEIEVDEAQVREIEAK